MTDFRLKVFCSVARHLSFTRAAKQLGVTQPAISSHIQELEQELGVQLFVRHSNHIELTAAGEALLYHAERILRDYEKLHYDMRVHSRGLSGVLRLGASTTIARYMLPECLASFTTKFKQIKTSLVEGNSQEIMQAVDNGSIDVGMVESNNRLAHLRYTPIMHDEIVLLVPTTAKWRGVDVMSIDELKIQPLVMANDESDTTHCVASNLAEQGLKLSQFNILMQLADEESIKRFAREADCVMFLSKLAARQEIESGIFKIVKVEGLPPIERELSFVRNTGATSDIAKDFIDYMQENMWCD